MAYNAIATHNNTVRETEVFFLTSGSAFTPRRSGLARVVRVGGGGPGGSVSAQPNRVAVAAAGGTSGGIVETWEYLEGGIAYPYSIGTGGMAGIPGSSGGRTSFNGASASGGTGGSGINQVLAADTIWCMPAFNSPKPSGSNVGGTGEVYLIQWAQGNAISALSMRGGKGGNSPFGTGGDGGSSSWQTVEYGSAGTGYGTGGSGGAVVWTSTPGTTPGGNGTPGCIEITMFYDTGDSATYGGTRGIRHSTGEYATGDYWIDGKPIYARVIEIRNMPGTIGTTYYPVDNSESIGTVISLQGTARNVSMPDTAITLPRAWPNEPGGDYGVDLFWNKSRGMGITIGIGMFYANYSGAITMKYTKADA